LEKALQYAVLVADDTLIRCITSPVVDKVDLLEQDLESMKTGSITETRLYHVY
jgi:hypothetical protein